MLRKGLLIVVSGPSGTGKGTVLKCLKESHEHVKFSVSATTRSPREGEQEGINYFFKTIEQFKQMINNDELVEWVEYCDNYYGTPKKYIEDSTKIGCDVILELEVEGAINIKKMYPECVCVFIIPPSFDELRQRINGRGTELPEIIEKRLYTARNELLFIKEYDYVIINKTIETAVNEIHSIILAEKLKYSRNNSILNEIGMS